MTHPHSEPLHLPTPKPVANVSPALVNRKVIQANKWEISSHNKSVSKLLP